MENWKSVPNFDGRFEVSDLGRVRKWVSQAGKRLQHPQLKHISTDEHGYPLVSFCMNTRKPNEYKETWRLHRLVLSVFNPTSDWTLQAAHRNGIKSDCRLENLEWATAQENSNHKILHKTILRGSDQRQSKINERMALAIRELHEIDGVTQATLGRRFRISAGTVASIVNGRLWKHATQTFVMPIDIDSSELKRTESA